MGVNIRPEPEGMRVTIVHEGTPAETAGLLPGDLILSVDGVPTQGMDLDTFLQHGLGEEGTDVELEVRDAEGHTELVVVRRAILDLEE
jgi:carboxyl-terminal processing protease